MTDLKIRTFPDPSLRRKAKRVERVTPLERKILADMAQTMYLGNGVGLAAIQVGIDKQLIVIDVGSGLIKLINPAILNKEGVSFQEEGCLSVPEFTIKIKRANAVLVAFLDEEGTVKQLKAEGLLARAIQHEMDHLSGILIIDYANPIRKILAKNKLSKKAKISRRAP